MGNLAIAVALIFLGGPESEQDVVWFKKDRPPARGIIVEETKEKIKLAVLWKSDKGQTSSTAAIWILKSDIRNVDRISDTTRRRLIQKYIGSRDRASRMAEALEKIKTRRVSFHGMTGREATGKHFRVRSTCEEAFVKEVAYYLDEVFAAYRECFEIQRNADKRVNVFVLSDMEEYTRFQKQTFGGAVRNPALYSPRKNFIAACNMIQKEEAAAIRKTILKLERVIKDKKKEVTDAETKIRREMIQFRKKVRAEADAAKRKIRAGNFANKNALLRKVDTWKRGELGRGERLERAANKQLDALREQADKVIAHNRKVIAHNHRVLVGQNKVMFEALFHEGFHAFAQNFLWIRGTQSAVPRWLDEALACYYEMSAVDAGELVHGAPNPWLLALYRKASREGKLLPIETVLRGDATKFLVAHRSQVDRSNCYYAQSWALGHYMAGRVPRKKLQAYVVAVMAGVDTVEAFEKMMGGSVRQVEVNVRQHLQSLK